MRLDDYDKIPCSAKEAWSYMQNGGYAFAENWAYRTVPDGQAGFKLLFLNTDKVWADTYGPNGSGGICAPVCFDWFKLVPKKKEPCGFCGFDIPMVKKPEEKKRERGSRRCDKCGFLFHIEDPSKFICPGCEPKPDRFAAINTLIATYCDKISATHVMAAFLQDFARAIVDLIEKGKV